MYLKGNVLLETIEVRKFNPVTSGKHIVDRKIALKNAIEKKISKIVKVRERCKDKPIAINVKFYLLKTRETGRSKKDLDNLLKVLCDVLPERIIANSTEEKYKGLGLISDDSFIYEIHCAKKVVLHENEEGLDLQIYESSEK